MADLDYGPDPVAQLARRIWRGITTRRGITTAVVSLILLQLIFRTWATSGSWFMWDDFIFLADVARGDDDLGWLVHSHFGLFMPLSFLLVKIVGGAGLSWGVMASQMLLLQLLADLACWWMLRVVFGNRARILIPLAFYLFIPLTAPASVWWSVAINQYPHHIGIFGAIAAHVMYARSGRVRHALLAAAFLALAMASYVKAPLVVVVLVALSIFWFTSGSWRTRARTMLRSWPAWSLYGALTGAYILVWRHQQLGSTPRQSCELSGTLSQSFVDTLGTGILGGPWRWDLWTGGLDPALAVSKCIPGSYRGDHALLVGGAPQSLANAPLLGIVLAWLSIACVTFYIWARFRNALLSLWFLLPYATASAALVFLGRSGTFGGAVSSHEIRYFSDLAAVLALAIGTVLMPIIGASVEVEERQDPYLRVRLKRWMVVTLGAAVFVGSIVSTITYVHPWHSTDARDFPERAFMQTAIKQIEDRPASDGRLQLADYPVPIVVGNPVISPYNLPSRKLATLSNRVDFVKAGTDLSILDSSGNVKRATVSADARAFPGPVPNCGYLVQEAGLSIPINPVVDQPWWIRIDYLASDDGTVGLESGDTMVPVKVERGPHSMYALTLGAYDRVNLRTFGDKSVCINNIYVGTLQPEGTNP